MKNNNITRADLVSYLNDKTKERFFQFQQLIFEEQNHREAELDRKQSSFISDRGPDPLAFVEVHINHTSVLRLAETAAARACLQRYRSSQCKVVIVCPLHEIADDNVRMVPTHEEQIRYTECLKSILDELNVPYLYCDKTDRQERVKWLEKVITE